MFTTNENKALALMSTYNDLCELLDQQENRFTKVEDFLRYINLIFETYDIGE